MSRFREIYEVTWVYDERAEPDTFDMSGQIRDDIAHWGEVDLHDLSVRRVSCEQVIEIPTSVVEKMLVNVGTTTFSPDWSGLVAVADAIRTSLEKARSEGGRSGGVD